MKNGMAGWVLGAGLIAAIIGAGAFVMFINPELEARSEAREQITFVQEEVDLLEINIRGMQARANQIPQLEAAWASVYLDLHPRPNQDEFYRTIVRALEQYNVPLQEASFGTLVPVEPVFETPEEDVPPPPDNVPDGTDELPPPDDAAPAEPADPGSSGDGSGDVLVFEGELENLYAMPVTVRTVGKLEDVLSVMALLQAQEDRFFTVSSLDIRRAQPEDERPLRPSITDSDVELLFTGYIFVLLHPEDSVLPDTGTLPPPFNPGDSTPDGFRPLPGTEETGD